MTYGISFGITKPIQIFMDIRSAAGMILVATIDGLTLEKVLKISRTFLVRIFFDKFHTRNSRLSGLHRSYIVGNVLAAFVEQNDSLAICSNVLLIHDAIAA
jgi:hypothetical protein